MGLTAFDASAIVSGTIAAARLASGTADNTTYLRGDNTWQVVSAGVSGSTGSVDNVLLRSDGTGGSTLQASSIVIPDNYTASPNNTVNHASIQAIGSTTNVSVSIVTKGSGAFCLAVPDGTSTGGNARGANAVDLQKTRTSATQVASGTTSFLAGTAGCAASGICSAVIGSSSCNSENTHGLIIAGSNSSIAGSGSQVLVTGDENTAGSNSNQVIMGRRGEAYPNASSFTHSSAEFQPGLRGESRFFRIVGQVKTTTNAAVEMQFGVGVNNVIQHLQIQAGRVISGTLLIQGVKSDGSVAARYCRHFTIRRVVNTTTLDNVETVGVDYASGTSISITADDANDRLKIEVTGIASETWRWNCVAECIDILYGS